MEYYPEKHRRRSIRLKGYDYGTAGVYFVTFCTRGRECLLGKIACGKMILSPEGEVVKSVWEGLPSHYPRTGLDAAIIMPNHFHGIIILHDHPGNDVGAGLRPAHPLGGTRRATLTEIVRALKSFSARGINQIRENPGTPVWQRNYYEHIIRNEAELFRARRYIEENPLKWETDEENPNPI